MVVRFCNDLDTGQRLVSSVDMSVLCGASGLVKLLGIKQIVIFNKR